MIENKCINNARMIALQSLLHVNVEDGYSNIVLDKALTKAKLNIRDASLASALFYGVLERRITLDYVIKGYSKLPLKKMSSDVLEILRMGIYQLLYMDKIPPSAAVNESVKLARLRKQDKATGFINGILRSFIRADCKFALPPEEENESLYLSIKHSCPEWLVQLWVQSYGLDCTVKLLQALTGRPPLTARVNTIRNSEGELIEKLKNQNVKAVSITGLNNAIQLEGMGAVEKNDCFLNGDFHIQDLASQLCCMALNPQPGQRVIDVCSAPGGKTFTIAEMMQNTGEILAFDFYDAKVKLVQEGAQRLGISIIKADVRDAKAPAKSLPLVDRVLCDVPCSGLGIIRRKPEIRYKKDHMLDSLPNLQYLILCESSKLVKVNGMLVYSTCTLNPSENNSIADQFLLEHPDFVAEPLSLPAGFTTNSNEPMNQLTLMPHIHETDGFFISAFRRLR